MQPVGLVVAPAVLSALQLFPNQSTAHLSARQRQPLQMVPSFALLSAELLDWGDADLVAASELETVPEVVLAETGETLRRTHGVPKLEGEGLQALVLDLSQWRDASGKPDPQWGLDFDANWNPTGHGWDATPQQRFERLLKETEIPRPAAVPNRHLVRACGPCPVRSRRCSPHEKKSSVRCPSIQATSPRAY